MRPHTPLVVPQAYFDRFPLEDIVLPELLAGDADDTFLEANSPGKQSLGRKLYNALVASYGNSDTALRHYYQAYLASIAFADEQVGRVLDALENSPFRDNTIVILASDHGYTLGEKDYLFKNNLWESATRIPLIIYDPRTKSVPLVDAPVSLIDLYPTIAQITQASGALSRTGKAAQLFGSSLVPLMSGADGGGQRFVISERQAGGQKGAMHVTLRTARWRYILYQNGKEELYDHQLDPREIANLAYDDEHAPRKRELRARLDALLGRAN